MIEELHSNGTYAKAVIHDDSKDKIYKLMGELNIANKIPKSDLHTTVMYSKKPCPAAMEMHDVHIPFNGEIVELRTWDTADGHTCLVAVVDCPPLKDLHYLMREKYNASYDFPEYNAHVTLSYDCGNEAYILPNNEYVVKYTTLSVKPLKPLNPISVGD